MEAAHTKETGTGQVLTRDRILVGVMLLLLAGIGWAYMVYMIWAMSAGAASLWLPAHPAPPVWGAFDFVINFLMWELMMVAMMLPSIYQTVTFYAAISRNRLKRGLSATTPVFFVLGYLGSWGLYSMAMVLLQWQLLGHGLLDHMLESRSYLLSGLIVLGAGIYQWTPYKDACLRYCRWPLGYLLSNWRDGVRGALRMGFKHGGYCVGCCWSLMLVLFVVGMMNMLWLLVFTLFVLLEKTVLPERLGKSIVGGALLISGTTLLVLHVLG